ncbi:hypothetical protein TYM08_P3591 [Marinicellulosiphila megalodicopiae]
MCIAGQGVARVPKLVLTDEVKKGDLLLLFDDYLPVSVDIFLIYPSRKYLSSKVRSFIDFLVNKIG